MNRFVKATCLAAALAGYAEAKDVLPGGMIPVTDKNVVNGLSPYNWVCKDNYISTTVCGASLTLGFKGTRQVAMQVDLEHIKKATASATRYPIIAWSVNGGAFQSHQLTPGEKSVVLVSNMANPVIDLYIKGMSPFENRYHGDVPGTAIKITGFAVDKGGVTKSVSLPGKVWLNIGDSIMSGDGAAYTKGQGRPHDDLWAESDDGRACYGYLLAHHYGYRESRIAYGGYNWTGGLGGVARLGTLIDQKTSTVKRLEGEVLKPSPDVVLINLGENGVPADKDVIESLTKVRSRIGKTAKLIVMIPISGRGRTEITRAFNSYKTSANDTRAYWVDLGPIKFSTCDGQHPEAVGHQTVFKAALPAFDAIIKSSPSAPAVQPKRISLWNGRAPAGEGKVVEGDAFITVYRPANANGAAAVICPGGAYQVLCVEVEGHGIAQWLNQHGITGIVLEYRLPHGNRFVPLLDAQRAIRLARAKAGEWGIDPGKIGIIGFSAGGHLASTAATHFDGGKAGNPDPVNKLSCRPDFAILVYPVITMGEKTHEGTKRNLLGNAPDAATVDLYSNEKQVTDKTPPTFLAHAKDDGPVSPDNSRMFYEAMKAHKVPGKYLELPDGGHGLNGYQGPSWDAWRAQSLQWMAEIKMIPESQALLAAEK